VGCLNSLQHICKSGHVVSKLLGFTFECCWLQALAELFCHVAAQRATAQHQVLVAQQDLGVLVAGALGALKLQVPACALLRSKYALLLQTLIWHASAVSKSLVCQHFKSS